MAFFDFRSRLTHAHRPGLLVADLRELGVNRSMLGDGGMGGLKAELFASGAAGVEPLQLAQDPNPHANGTWVWAGYSDILASNVSWFVLRAAAPGVQINRWRAAVNMSLYGHWDNDYGDMKSYRVLSMAPTRQGDTEAYNISLDGAVNVAPGRRFVATDALELVDNPGEYWIDRTRCRVYLLPPREGLHSRSYLLSVAPSLADSSATKPPDALLELQGVSHIRFQDLTFAASARSLLKANGSTGLEIDGCEFVGAGSDCVSVTDATNSWIRGGVIAQCGATGLTMTGGVWSPDKDELSLFSTPVLPEDLWVPANVSLIGTQIHHWARLQRISNNPGVIWTGVGHTIRGCTMNNAPSPAVLNQGSMDFIFEQNEISYCPYEYNDMGAYYHGGSAGGYQYGWTQTGNIIRENFFQSVKYIGRVPDTDDYNFTLNGLTTQAIYLDDGHSGYTVHGNRFADVEMGIVLGGGRRHTVVNNTFVSCLRACIHIDNRGMNWAHELCGCQCSFGTCKPGCSTGAAIGPGLNETDWTVTNTTRPPEVHGYPPFRFEQGVRKLRCAGLHVSRLCKARLPWLQHMLQDATGGGPCAPAHNLVTKNAFVAEGCPTPWQKCGFINNASDFTLECSLHPGPDLKIVEAWGSHAEGNTMVQETTSFSREGGFFETAAAAAGCGKAESHCLRANESLYLFGPGDPESHSPAACCAAAAAWAPRAGAWQLQTRVSAAHGPECHIFSHFIQSDDNPGLRCKSGPLLQSPRSLDS
eukprot:SAG31_NODE_39_length_31377_cov_5.971482_2_plen_756_part_00